MGNETEHLRYELYMVRGPEPGKTIPLFGASLSIGRDPQSDFLINDPEVSRQQALLIRNASGEYQIQDLGSTNGTYVDGQRLGTNPVILRPLQAVTVGGAVTFILRKRALNAASPSFPEDAGVEGPHQEDSPHEHANFSVDSDTDEPPAAASYSPQESKLPSESAGESEAKPAVEKPAGPPLREPGNKAGHSQAPAQVKTTVESAGTVGSYDTEATQGLSPNLILSLVLLLLCGCTATLLFMFYLGGDWLLRQIGLVP